MSRKRNVESEGGVVFIDPKMKALSSLDGEIGWLAAFPYGLQHVLAMFVANLAPIAIIAAAAGLPEDLRATLIQNAMFIAGIGTFVQLYPAVAGGQRAVPSSWASASRSFPWPAPLRRPRATGRSWERSSSAACIEGLLGLFAPLVAAYHHAHRGGRGGDLYRVLAARRGGGLLRRRLRTRRISAAPRQPHRSAPSRFWRALCSRVSPRAPLNSYRCSSALSWGIWWPFRWARWTSPDSPAAQLFSLPGVLPVTPEFNPGCHHHRHASSSSSPPPRPWATARRSRPPRCAATPRTRSSPAP